MRADQAKAISAAKRILKKYPGQRLPIKVEVIAKDLGASIAYDRFENDSNMSAMLYRDSKKTVIGVNSLHSILRQRFSIAHEIGHLVLHNGELYIDRSAKVNFRDHRASLAIDSEEIEANTFAAELLMPENIVITETKRFVNNNSKSDPSELIVSLAKKFKVSQKAIDYRLQNLHLIVSIPEGSDD